MSAAGPLIAKKERATLNDDEFDLDYYGGKHESKKPIAKPIAIQEKKSAEIGNLRPSPDKQTLKIIPASDVKSRTIEWFLKDYIPCGTFCILQGDGGIGKTTIALDLISRLSNADDLPDGLRPKSTPARSLIFTGEDNHSILKARLQAGGANLEYVSFVPHVSDGDEIRPFALPNDVERLRDAIERYDAALVYIDNLFDSLSSNIDTNKDKEVRSALRPLGDVASATGAVILGTRHIKKEGGRANHRGMGSVAFSNVARSVLSVAPHPQEPEVYLVSVAKGNYAKAPMSLKYRIVSVPIVLDDGKASDVPRIEWLGLDETTADEAALLTPSKHSIAKDGVSAAVRDSGEFSKEKLARELHVSPDTIGRAMEALSEEFGWVFDKKKTGFGEGSQWLYQVRSSAVIAK